MLFYRAALPLSSRTLTFVADLIRRHRKSIGSCWRKLNPGQQALLVLAYLRKGETFAELAAGFAVGTTTAWRYVEETVELLAARAPKLRQAVRAANKAGYAYVVLDGTLIPVDRVAADRPFYSGKHKKHGMNLQVIASPGGDILWVSGTLPGSVHDKKAEWIWGVLAELEAAGLVTLADKGYQGSTWAKVPYKGKNKPESQKEANRAHAKLRGPGERANAQLKTWDILDKLRCCPSRAGKIAKAIHALQLREAYPGWERLIVESGITYPDRVVANWIWLRIINLATLRLIGGHEVKTRPNRVSRRELANIPKYGRRWRVRRRDARRRWW